MPTVTENLGLFQPDAGQSGVATELNNNWSSLDQRFDEAGGHTHDGTPGQGPKVPVTSLATTGTPSATTYLRGDGLWTTGTGGGGGVTDHGALTGLTDDDHPQYANQSRGDARYVQKANNLSDLANTATARTNIGAAAAVHQHAGADITTGTVPTARLGSGTPNTATFLRGDQTWAVPGAGGSVNLDDLADVLITSPADNQVLSYDAAGARWINEAAAVGVTNEDIDDRVAALIVAGTGITSTYDDTANTLTIAASGGGGGTTILGLQPFAYPMHLSPANPLLNLFNLSVGFTVLCPFAITASMLVTSITWRNADTSGARSAEWRLYQEPAGGSTTLTHIAGLNGSGAFSAPGVASRQTIAATTPTTIGPGIYWLALRNNHASATCLLSGYTPGADQAGMALTMLQYQAGLAALGATLTAGTGWTKDAGIPAIRLNGRVFGQSSIW